MSSISTALLSGTAASLISMIGMGHTPPGRRLINDLVGRIKPEGRYGEHRKDMSRSQAEHLNARREARQAKRAARANQLWIDLKPLTSMQQRQWS